MELTADRSTVLRWSASGPGGTDLAPTESGSARGAPRRDLATNLARRRSGQTGGAGRPRRELVTEPAELVVEHLGHSGGRRQFIAGSEQCWCRTVAEQLGTLRYRAVGLLQVRGGKVTRARNTRQMDRDNIWHGRTTIAWCQSCVDNRTYTGRCTTCLSIPLEMQFLQKVGIR